MPALAIVQDRPRLELIEGGLGRKRGKPTAADEAALEMRMRADEERQMADQLFPLMQRALMVARTHGSAEFRLVASIDHILGRHARRWAPDPDGAA